MRFLITGENGFVARNLIVSAERMGHEVVRLAITKDNHEQMFSLIGPDVCHFAPVGGQRAVPCVHKVGPDGWRKLIETFQVDVVVHNAAVVGTDVVGLDPAEATLTNVLGTRNVCEGAEAAGVPVCYMGTSVIYDPAKFQDHWISEIHALHGDTFRPPTYYGQLKLAGEGIVQNTCTRWSILRPLFAYGGLGDMNSLIAKGFYAHLTGRDRLDIFLDPTKIKDYLHVSDFCRAVVMACEQGLWGEDYNVAAETPGTVGDIVQIMDDALIDVGLLRGDSDLGEGLERIIQWHPETDYLGNHRMASQKLREASGWIPELTLYEGLGRTLAELQRSLKQHDRYDPLEHLDRAAKAGVDLTEFFPK